MYMNMEDSMCIGERVFFTKMRERVEDVTDKPIV